MVYRIAIIGRPNVGKSRLFNRLTGSREALVCEYAGLTRDYQEAPCALENAGFWMIDTPGLIPKTSPSEDALQKRMNAQTERAALLADALFFVIDAQEGLTSVDRDIAEWLRLFFRRSPQKPVVLLVNKAEHRHATLLGQEATHLGWGTPIFLSAEHGQGMDTLYAWFAEQSLSSFPVPPESSPLGINQKTPTNETDADAFLEDPLPVSIRITIMGRPNAGKSTLVNALLGEERLLTGPESGLTRDSISIPWSYRGRALTLIDTAGQRKNARVTHVVEKMTQHDGQEALKYTDVAILVMDACHLFEKQDLHLAQNVMDEGRVLVLALNKWDQMTDLSPQWKSQMQAQIDTTLGNMKGVLWFPISARDKIGFDPLLRGAIDAYTRWNKRIPTSPLNRWLKEAMQQHPPPASHGVSIRAKYITQIKTHPPTFRLFGTHTKNWPESYTRYLINRLRETFHLEGIPVRIQLRQSDNPYTPPSI